jgi:hypothetical protein
MLLNQPLIQAVLADLINRDDGSRRKMTHQSIRCCGFNAVTRWRL